MSTMRKTKVYLDTSVISHLDQPEKPVEQEYSKTLWQRLISGTYEVFVSQVVFEEIDRCKTEKKDRLYAFLAQIPFRDYPLTYEVTELAELIIKQNILTRNSYNDCRHISVAVLSHCDYLLTWNIKHLANFTTNNNVRNIIIGDSHQPLSIISPKTFVHEEGERNDEK
jgi:predicted nucleic acid-binding protein